MYTMIKTAVNMEPKMVRRAVIRLLHAKKWLPAYRARADLQKATPRSESDTTYWTIIAAMPSPHPIYRSVRKEVSNAMHFFALMLAIAARKTVIQTEDTRDLIPDMVYRGHEWLKYNNASPKAKCSCGREPSRLYPGADCVAADTCNLLRPHM
jgi:hypothetical protein